MNVVGRVLTDVRVWTYRSPDEVELTIDGQRFWLCFADGFEKVTAGGDGSLALEPAVEFSADDLRADLDGDAAIAELRWLSVVHLMFSDLPDLPVVGCETVEQAGVTSVLELRLGNGEQWIRFDACHICGSLTVSGGFRQGPS